MFCNNCVTAHFFFEIIKICFHFEKKMIQFNYSRGVLYEEIYYFFVFIYDLYGCDSRPIICKYCEN